MPLSVAAFGVCMVLAAAPAVAPQFVPTDRFTLAWTHSIEKVRWEEDYRVVAATGSGHKAHLVAGSARVKGSAAGMEPPDGSTLQDGWYHYMPQNTLVEPLRLTRSEYTPDYQWCVNGRCIPLSAIMPTDGDVTLLYACQAP